MVKLSIRIPAELVQAAKVKAALLGGKPLEAVVAYLLDRWVGQDFRERLAALAQELAAHDAAMLQANGGERPAWTQAPRRRSRGKAASGPGAEEHGGQ